MDKTSRRISTKFEGRVLASSWFIPTRRSPDRRRKMGKKDETPEERAARKEKEKKGTPHERLHGLPPAKVAQGLARVGPTFPRSPPPVGSSRHPHPFTAPTSRIEHRLTGSRPT